MLNQKYTAIELDQRDDCREVQAALGQITGASTVRKTQMERNNINS